jgi:hypothetical protein
MIQQGLKPRFMTLWEDAETQKIRRVGGAEGLLLQADAQFYFLRHNPKRFDVAGCHNFW